MCTHPDPNPSQSLAADMQLRVHRTSRSDAKTRRCGALPLRSRLHSASSSSSPMHRLAT